MPLNPALPIPPRLRGQRRRLRLYRREGGVLLYDWKQDPGYKGSKGGKWINEDNPRDVRYQANKPGTGRQKKQPGAEAAPGAGAAEGAAEGKQPAGKKQPAPKKPAAAKKQPAPKKPKVDHNEVGDRIEKMLATGDFSDQDLADLKEQMQGLTGAQFDELTKRFKGHGVKGGRTKAAKQEGLAAGVEKARKKPAAKEQPARKKPPIAIGPEDVEGLVDTESMAGKPGWDRAAKKPRQKKATAPRKAEPGKAPRTSDIDPEGPIDLDDLSSLDGPGEGPGRGDDELNLPPLDDEEPAPFGVTPEPSMEHDGGDSGRITAHGAPVPEETSAAFRRRRAEPTPTPRQLREATGAVLKAIKGLPVHDVADVRERMPEHLRGRAFDEAVLALADAGKVHVTQDAHAARVRPGHIGDGDAAFTTIGDMSDSGSDPPARLGVEPSEVPGSPEHRPPELPEPPAREQPAKKPTKKPGADAGALADEVADLYENAASEGTTRERVEAAASRLATLPKADLVKAAERIGLLGMHRKARGAIAKAIGDRIMARKGASLRVALNHRPFPDDGAGPPAPPAREQRNRQGLGRAPQVQPRPKKEPAPAPAQPPRKPTQLAPGQRRPTQLRQTTEGEGREHLRHPPAQTQLKPKPQRQPRQPKPDNAPDPFELAGHLADLTRSGGGAKEVRARQAELGRVIDHAAGSMTPGKFRAWAKSVMGDRAPRTGDKAEVARALHNYLGVHAENALTRGRSERGKAAGRKGAETRKAARAARGNDFDLPLQGEDDFDLPEDESAFADVSIPGEEDDLLPPADEADRKRYDDAMARAMQEEHHARGDRRPARRAASRAYARSPVGIVLSARNPLACRPLLYAAARKRPLPPAGQRPDRHAPVGTVSVEEHLRRVLEAPYAVPDEYLTLLRTRLLRLAPGVRAALERRFPGGEG